MDGSSPKVSSVIWKYYPPTGVLKLCCLNLFKGLVNSVIWKYYPPTGVLKLLQFLLCHRFFFEDLEVLPAYWGIETFCLPFFASFRAFHLEVLPAYWGIETLQLLCAP